MQRDEVTKEEVRYLRHQFTTGVSHRELVLGSQTERKHISYFLFFSFQGFAFNPSDSVFVLNDVLSEIFSIIAVNLVLHKRVLCNFFDLPLNVLTTLNHTV